MKRGIFLLIGILVILPAIVSAEADRPCTQNSDCVLKQRPYCCGERIEYDEACYLSQVNPENVTCSPDMACKAGMQLIDGCVCENSVCTGVSNQGGGSNISTYQNDSDYCGNGECERGEDLESCPQDCLGVVPECGNDICERVVCTQAGCPRGENSKSCPSDCPRETSDECGDSDGGNNVLEYSETIIKNSITRDLVTHNDSCFEASPTIQVSGGESSQAYKLVNHCSGKYCRISEGYMTDIDNCEGDTRIYYCPEGCNYGACDGVKEDSDTESGGERVGSDSTVYRGEKYQVRSTRTLLEESGEVSMQLSNGGKAGIKVVPETASTMAIERLKLKVCSEENNCTIILKEVGKGEEAKAAYEVEVDKQGRFLGIFKIQARVQAQIDAESGEVISVKKPWWSFLASKI